jgi:hypothetical protein
MTGCKNCTHTECDVCEFTNQFANEARDGTVTCDLTSGLATDCQAGFGFDPSTVLPEGYSSRCY